MNWIFTVYSAWDNAAALRTVCEWRKQVHFQGECRGHINGCNEMNETKELNELNELN